MTLQHTMNTELQSYKQISKETVEYLLLNLSPDILPVTDTREQLDEGQWIDSR